MPFHRMGHWLKRAIGVVSGTLGILGCNATPSPLIPPPVKAVAHPSGIDLESGSLFSRAVVGLALGDCASDGVVFDEHGRILIIDYVVPAPRVTKQVLPEYPAHAKRSKLAGEVTVMVTVDETGVVSNVSVQKSDNQLLNSASVGAARQWQYVPPVDRCGRAVAVVIPITFKFSS